MRWMDLRYAGKCKVCGDALPVATRAFYDANNKTVTCSKITCAEADGLTEQKWSGSPTSGAWTTVLAETRIGTPAPIPAKTHAPSRVTRPRLTPTAYPSPSPSPSPSAPPGVPVPSGMTPVTPPTGDVWAGRAPSPMAGISAHEYQLTVEMTTFCRAVAGFADSEAPASVIATAKSIVEKLDAGTKAEPVNIKAEALNIGGIPPEVILKCPTCSHLSDSHECKEKES